MHILVPPSFPPMWTFAETSAPSAMQAAERRRSSRWYTLPTKREKSTSISKHGDPRPTRAGAPFSVVWRRSSSSRALHVSPFYLLTFCKANKYAENARKHCWGNGGCSCWTSLRTRDATSVSKYREIWRSIGEMGIESIGSMLVLSPWAPAHAVLLFFS